MAAPPAPPAGGAPPAGQPLPPAGPAPAAAAPVHAPLRRSDFFPSKFSGSQNQNPYAHWLAFDDYADLHQLNNNQRLDEFKRTLEGQARLWIENKQFANIALLRASFIEHFSGVHSREACVKLLRNTTYKVGESMEEYLGRIRPIAERLGYNNDLILDQFKEGLPHDIKMAVSMSRVVNLQDTVDAAQRYVDLQGGKSKEVSFTFASSDSEQELSKLQDVVSSLSDEVKQLSIRKDDRPSGRSSIRSPSPYRRHRSSSYSRRSPSPYRRPQSSSSSYSQEMKCHYCGIPGHRYAQCRSLKRDRMNNNVKTWYIDRIRGTYRDSDVDRRPRRERSFSPTRDRQRSRSRSRSESRSRPQHDTRRRKSEGPRQDFP